MDIKKYLGNPYDLIDDIADEEETRYFELDDILVDIATTLINYRINNNLTQKELSQKLGCTQAMVSKLESGEYNPSVEQLWKIASALGLEFKIIFKEKEQSVTIWDITDDNIISSNIEEIVGDAA
ncbi:helix-turn-helix domain-containing protein [Caloramator australicus]|uniref:COG1396: Predicted transcriptional regulators n=1 Tax=Caloramator australicus RC3 TaxID=857293 RepID=I7LH95_9CLOT|nr:helix-turn-helix transcriptional regulator [Caloramator australicus]CCJ33851.1 COG1396: Predicted transcriptional regulators [Caloramator australicus RC3]